MSTRTTARPLPVNESQAPRAGVQGYPHHYAPATDEWIPGARAGAQGTRPTLQVEIPRRLRLIYHLLDLDRQRSFRPEPVDAIAFAEPQHRRADG